MSDWLSDWLVQPRSESSHVHSYITWSREVSKDVEQ